MNTRVETNIHDHMAILAESVRSRLLFLLEKEELTVSDLCAVVQLPQSTVSRHLKTLLDRGWVDSRPDGPRRLYRSTVGELDESGRRLWDLTRSSLEAGPVGAADLARLKSVVSRRRSRSQEFFDVSGDRWDGLRDEMFGDRFSLEALLSLLPDRWNIGDLGCGSGRLIEAIAPWASRVVGVDSSQAMLDIARDRLDGFDNVDLRHGTLETLPVREGELDAAALMLVLHHLLHPQHAIAEAARCIKPDGRIVIVDMLPHDRIEYQQDMGHVWLGFSEELMQEFLIEAGFGAVRFRQLPPSPEAKGPNLFVVSATKKESVT